MNKKRRRCLYACFEMDPARLTLCVIRLPHYGGYVPCAVQVVDERREEATFEEQAVKFKAREEAARQAQLKQQQSRKREK